TDVLVDCQQGTGDGANQWACNLYRTDRDAARDLMFGCGFFEPGKPTRCSYSIRWSPLFEISADAGPTRESLLPIWRGNWNAICKGRRVSPPFCVTHPYEAQCQPHGL